MEKDLKTAAINFAVELCRVKSMPDMPSYFYEAVEKSFIKWARPITEADRAALHKEILAKAPNNPFGDDAFLAQTGFDTCLSQYRKAIDEVFSSKE